MPSGALGLITPPPAVVSLATHQLDVLLVAMAILSAETIPTLPRKLLRVNLYKFARHLIIMFAYVECQTVRTNGKKFNIF